MTLSWTLDPELSVPCSLLRRSPFKSAQSPEIHQRSGKDADEDQHFSISGPAAFTDRDGPGIDEDGFQVEDDEEHGDEVEFDIKANACRAGGQDAGLVGLVGLLLPVAFAEEVGERKHGGYEQQDRAEIQCKRPKN